MGIVVMQDVRCALVLLLRILRLQVRLWDLENASSVGVVFRVDKAEVLCLHHALESNAFSCGCVPHLCLEKTDAEISGALQRAKSGRDGSSSDEE